MRIVFMISVFLLLSTNLFAKDTEELLVFGIFGTVLVSGASYLDRQASIVRDHHLAQRQAQFISIISGPMYGPTSTPSLFALAQYVNEGNRARQAERRIHNVTGPIGAIAVVGLLVSLSTVSKMGYNDNEGSTYAAVNYYETGPSPEPPAWADLNDPIHSQNIFQLAYTTRF